MASTAGKSEVVKKTGLGLDEGWKCFRMIGRVLVEGTVKEVLSNIEVGKLFLGQAGIISTAAVSKLIQKNKALVIADPDVVIIEAEYSRSPHQQATIVLRLRMQEAGDRATGNFLEKALNSIGRDDIVSKCISNVAPVTDSLEKIIAQTHVYQAFNALESQIIQPALIKHEKRNLSLDVSYDEQDLMKLAVSNLIRKYKSMGGILLTTRHNSGVLDADFGIKYVGSNERSAVEPVTSAIYDNSLKLKQYEIVDLPQVDIDTIGTETFQVDGKEFKVEVIDSIVDYVVLMKEIFDFEKMKSSKLPILINCMNGVTAPYAEKIFIEELGYSPENVIKSKPLPDFGGLHPDPNLTYAMDKVDTMKSSRNLQFGVAYDSDGDRNMILGQWEIPDNKEDLILLRHLDTIISCTIRLKKILHRAKHPKPRRSYGLKREATAFLFKVLSMLFALSCFQKLVAIPINIERSHCTKDWSCPQCIASKCTYVEMENRTRLCVDNDSEVRGIKRRVFRDMCPKDLFPVKLDDWIEEKIEFIESEIYGYKVFTWISVPIVAVFSGWILFKIYKCWYHRRKLNTTRCSPLKNSVLPECLRECCYRKRIRFQSRSPSIEIVHYDIVSPNANLRVSLPREIEMEEVPLANIEVVPPEIIQEIPLAIIDQDVPPAIIIPDIPPPILIQDNYNTVELTTTRLRPRNKKMNYKV